MQTAIVATVTDRAAIVQAALWDWLRCAGPPYDLNTHTLRDISHMLSHGDFLPKCSAGLGLGHVLYQEVIKEIM